MLRSRLLAAAALLAAAPAAAEEPVPTLPCGKPAALEYTIRWRASDPSAGPLDGYVLMRGPGDEPGRWLEHIAIPTPHDDGGGVLSARVGGFMNTASWSIAIVATGPGGESPDSNILHVPALISGMCPPAAPTLLEIVDGLIEQSAAHTDALRALRLRVETSPPAQ